MKEKKEMFCTKFALTTGITKSLVYASDLKNHVFVEHPKSRWPECLHESLVHETEEEAQEAAKKMAAKKIKNLQKQIEKMQSIIEHGAKFQ